MQRAAHSSPLSAQGYVDDPRNEQVVVYVNGAFVPREAACVSVFDAGFVLGDGIWEGLRLVRGKLISLDAHLDRLFEGAQAIRAVAEPGSPAPITRPSMQVTGVTPPSVPVTNASSAE